MAGMAESPRREEAPPRSPGGGGPEYKRIGLLFVHGIGEQKRFEHLIASVGEFAELMLRAEPDSSVSVVDRTGGWTLPAGTPDPDGRAPMTLTLRTPGKHYEYECHEVWWADLGARSGVFDRSPSGSGASANGRRRSTRTSTALR